MCNAPISINIHPHGVTVTPEILSLVLRARPPVGILLPITPFPHGVVVNTRRFHRRAPGSIPGGEDVLFVYQIKHTPLRFISRSIDLLFYPFDVCVKTHQNAYRAVSCDCDI